MKYESESIEGIKKVVLETGDERGGTCYGRSRTSVYTSPGCPRVGPTSREMARPDRTGVGIPTCHTTTTMIP